MELPEEGHVHLVLTLIRERGLEPVHHGGLQLGGDGWVLALAVRAVVSKLDQGVALTKDLELIIVRQRESNNIAIN